MALQIFGEVICERIPWSRAFGRFVEKHIRQWLAARISETERGCPAHYHVVLEGLNPGHRLGCHVEIQLGNEVWKGSHYADNPHQGLILSLQHMMRVRIPSRPGLALT